MHSPKATRLLRLAFGLAGLPLLMAAPADAWAQGKTLPPELAIVPQDAAAFVHVRPAEIWQGEPTAALRKLFPDWTAAFLKELGENPAETESLSIVYPTTNGLGGVLPELRDASRQPFDDLVFIETTVKPFERSNVLTRVLGGKQYVETKHVGRTCFESAPTFSHVNHGAVHFINDRTYLFATSGEVMVRTLTALDRPRRDGPLAAALGLAAQKRHIVLGLNATHAAFAKVRAKTSADLQKAEGALAPLASLVPLLDVRSAHLAVSIGKETRLEGECVFPSPRHALEAQGHLEDALVLFRLFFLGQFRADMCAEIDSLIDEDEESVGPLTYADQVLVSSKKTILKQQRDLRPLVLTDLLLLKVESGLRRASFEQRQATITFHAQVPADLSLLETRGREEAWSLVKAHEPARHARRNFANLGKLMTAMHTYHEVYKHFPSSALCDKEGKPLLSWRVAILPYLGELALFQEFNLDQPWDSPHNIKLLAKMPAVYAIPGAPLREGKGEPFTTFYQVFTGPTAVFDLQSKVTLARITAGTGGDRRREGGVLGIIEAHEAVPWTRPVDVVFDPKKPLPKLGHKFPEPFAAVFMDGSFRNLDPIAEETAIRAMITYAGGEPINGFERGKK